MPNAANQEQLAQIKESLSNAGAVWVVNYRGLTVKQIQQLRRDIRANDAQMFVLKNTLMHIALEELEKIQSQVQRLSRILLRTMKRLKSRAELWMVHSRTLKRFKQLQIFQAAKNSLQSSSELSTILWQRQFAHSMQSSKHLFVQFQRLQKRLLKSSCLKVAS